MFYLSELGVLMHQGEAVMVTSQASREGPASEAGRWSINFSLKYIIVQGDVRILKINPSKLMDK